ncbi:hypothetical protein [Foetidibacter luteolus]|uniref:hypothetical protein n=1 Tax=Foetidibacter luteolus TaxID=2608880 RepID=UPI00129A71E5|nr:hypothetical protein [Foetidibacter luteolus]
MDTKAKFRKLILPAVVVFAIAIILSLALKRPLEQSNIDVNVLKAGNLILFLISILSSYMHLKAIQSANPAAFVRTIMATTVIKLLVIAIAILTYVFIAGKARNSAAVIICMGLYIVYTVTEVRTALLLNKSKNNGSH